MEISEQGYEVGTPSKTTAREDVDRASYVSKRKGGKPASPTNPKKGSAGKRKKKKSSTSKQLDGRKKTWFLHGPGHSSEECKLLKDYSQKYAVQRTKKEK